MMAVTWDTFEKWVNQLSKTVFDRNQVVHQVWIVPALFHARPYINDGQNFSGDGALENERIVAFKQDKA